MRGKREILGADHDGQQKIALMWRGWKAPGKKKTITTPCMVNKPIIGLRSENRPSGRGNRCIRIEIRAKAPPMMNIKCYGEHSTASRCAYGRSVNSQLFQPHSALR